MLTKWNKEAVAMEIVSVHEAGENLSYSNITGTNMALLRAAIRHFGSWEAAVTFAGIDYETIRRYKSWTRERIIARIQELHGEGYDLSWHNVRLNVDPQLAAAAAKKAHFGSWQKAVEAAGLDYESIRRYRSWDDQRVLNLVRGFAERGTRLNAKNIQSEDITLITAARRRFDSWSGALTAAGLDYRKIVQRAPFKRGFGRGQIKKNGTSNANTFR